MFKNSYGKLFLILPLLTFLGLLFWDYFSGITGSRFKRDKINGRVGRSSPNCPGLS